MMWFEGLKEDNEGCWVVRDWTITLLVQDKVDIAFLYKVIISQIVVVNMIQTIVLFIFPIRSTKVIQAYSFQELRLILILLLAASNNCDSKG